MGADVADPSEAGSILDGFLPLDLCDAPGVSNALERLRPDVVFHLAGVQSGEPPAIYRTNVLGTAHLLETARVTCRRARVLAVGSAAEYGPVERKDLPVKEETPCSPRGPYGVSKHASTLIGLDYARRLGMRVVVARPFNVVGAGIPPSLVVGALAARARKALAAEGDPVIQVGNLESIRDFIAVEDVVDAYVKMAAGEHWGEVFNVCSGEPHTVLEVAEALLSFAPRPVRLEVNPALVRDGEVSASYGSYEKARAAFGFTPATRLKDALRVCWAASETGAGT